MTAGRLSAVRKRRAARCFQGCARRPPAAPAAVLPPAAGGTACRTRPGSTQHVLVGVWRRSSSSTQAYAPPCGREAARVGGANSQMPSHHRRTGVNKSGDAQCPSEAQLPAPRADPLLRWKPLGESTPATRRSLVAPAFGRPTQAHWATGADGGLAEKRGLLIVRPSATQSASVARIG